MSGLPLLRSTHCFPWLNGKLLKNTGRDLKYHFQTSKGSLFACLFVCLFVCLCDCLCGCVFACLFGIDIQVFTVGGRWGTESRDVWAGTASSLGAKIYEPQAAIHAGRRIFVTPCGVTSFRTPPDVTKIQVGRCIFVPPPGVTQIHGARCTSVTPCVMTTRS